MSRRFLALGLVWLALSGCGGNVVVDHGGAGASGQGGNGAGGGSGGNVCQQAAKFVEKCSTISTGTGPPTQDCTGAVECTANCIVHSSCGALDGTDQAAALQLGSCLAACTGG
jgi:hypothetical protein